ncbi:MAG: hypothetical protein LBH75_00635, partial [Treponema sp.]|nr:hypothetical protein [Treponema sp.]
MKIGRKILLVVAILNVVGISALALIVMQRTHSEFSLVMDGSTHAMAERYSREIQIDLEVYLD